VTATEEAKTLTTVSQTDLLQLYALFKQSIFGDNGTDRPGMFDMKGKAKWDAWTEKKGMPKEVAQQAYIDLVAGLKG
jgi:diazepam-binding inhibitor (GABA receptor modulating acyl-CoA-binding protein)